VYPIRPRPGIHIMQRPILLILAGFVLGILALAGFRFVAAHGEEPVHYHANFAVFLDGERLDLTDDRFMEDVAACAGDPRNLPPTERVHLHNNDHDVVHVHHAGATWGHLFANLRMVLGDRLLVTRDGDVFTEGDDRSFKFILNGRSELSVFNQLIRPGDRLLISFGPESDREVLQTQFPQVLDNAPAFDLLDDPVGCGAAAHDHGFLARLRHAFVG
jgi:hypothetical protein